MLSRILQIQKRDTHDIENIYHIYQALLAYETKPGLSWEAASQDLGKASGTSYFAEERWSGTVDQAIEIVREYLIGGTAKDCSVFISLFSLKKFGDASAEDFKTLPGGEYAYRVRVVDLVSDVCVADKDRTPNHCTRFPIITNWTRKLSKRLTRTKVPRQVRRRRSRPLKPIKHGRALPSQCLECL